MYFLANVIFVLPLRYFGSILKTTEFNSVTFDGKIKIGSTVTSTEFIFIIFIYCQFYVFLLFIVVTIIVI